MSEYIEREAAVAKITELINQSGKYTDYECGADDACYIVNYIPAANVRPVVFCKDCRHRDPEDHKCDSGERERQGCPFKVADDYFCAFGEK